MKRLLALLLLGFIGFAHADQLEPFGYVKMVTDNNGDTVNTSQVSVGVCPGTSCPTLISPAITNKTNRRRVLVNTGSYALYIGSNTTTLSTIGYQISESTGTHSTFTTYNTAAIYGVAVTTTVVSVIQETNSNP